jgi:hypothetical protein
MESDPTLRLITRNKLIAKAQNEQRMQKVQARSTNLAQNPIPQGLSVADLLLQLS